MHAIIHELKITHYWSILIDQVFLDGHNTRKIRVSCMIPSKTQPLPCCASAVKQAQKG